MRIPNLSLSAIGASVATLAALAIPGATIAEDEVPRWQQARAVGEAENCISQRRIRRTSVHDDRTIDFHLTNGRTYRNVLPHRCGGLGFEETFSYRTRMPQLCSTDVITVLRQPIRRSVNGPSCGLGQFQEIELPERG